MYNNQQKTIHEISQENLVIVEILSNKDPYLSFCLFILLSRLFRKDRKQ